MRHSGCRFRRDRGAALERCNKLLAGIIKARTLTGYLREAGPVPPAATTQLGRGELSPAFAPAIFVRKAAGSP